MSERTKLFVSLIVGAAYWFFAIRGDVKPTPIDPVNPPSPVVPVTPPPFPSAGLSVLITYDPNSDNTLPREQQAILNSGSLRTYLSANCPELPDGDPGWKIVPNDTEFPASMSHWSAAMAVPRASEPWLVISNGKIGESVALPANEDAVMVEIRKYGGK